MTQSLPFHIYGFSLCRALRLLRQYAYGGNDTERISGKSRGSVVREDVFMDLIRRHAGIIERICRSFAGDEDEKEDLSQDVLVNIWRGVGSFRAEADVKTWIYRVTMNTCVSSQRRRPKWEKMRLDHAPEARALTEQAGNAASAYEAPPYDASQWLQVMLNLLPLDDHAIMAMWLDDLSYDEIAEVMGMNRNTVATRVRRAKERLRNAYPRL